jgi:pimeloyl-ACP methyl ester carboxylesterase
VAAYNSANAMNHLNKINDQKETITRVQVLWVTSIGWNVSVRFIESGPMTCCSQPGRESAVRLIKVRQSNNGVNNGPNKKDSKMNYRKLRFRLIIAMAAFFIFCLARATSFAASVKNIVLVHGAWADGSGWRDVYNILVKDGYQVSIVQEPETSFKDDVAATRRIIALQDGRCILVAHSYGGAVITEAGMDPSVAGLVYIAAHMPDAGENEADDGKRFPSDLSKSSAIKKTADGFTYLDPAQFHEYFAADLSAEQAAFMARSQVPNAAENFKTVITTAAWKSKPSWMLVAGKDRTINPDLERWYAKRAGSHTVEIAGASHSVYVSRPKEVAALIEEAASHIK